MKHPLKQLGLMSGILGIVLVTLVACIAPIQAPQGSTANPTTDTTTSVASDGAVTIIGGDEAALRNFLARWLAPIYPNTPATQMTVTIGSLPTTMPISLTLPSTMTAVGGIVQTGEYANTQLLLSTEQAAAALETITQQLAAQGFAEPETQQRPSPRGFQPSEPMPSILCRAADDLSATLFSSTDTAGVTDIRLSLNVSEPYGGPCTGPTGPMQGEPAVLPTLKAPANAIVRSSSSGYGGDQAEVTAEIEFAEDVKTLADHYNSQLTEAGWEQVEASSADNITWSTWTLVDDEENTWHITFYIVRQAAESDTYLATLRLRRQR